MLQCWSWYSNIDVITLLVISYFLVQELTHHLGGLQFAFLSPLWPFTGSGNFKHVFPWCLRPSYLWCHARSCGFAKEGYISWACVIRLLSAAVLFRGLYRPVCVPGDSVFCLSIPAYLLLNLNAEIHTKFDLFSFIL